MSTALAPSLVDSAQSPPPTLEECFPNSTKVYIEGPRGIRVPMREISLSGGEPPLRVYDTSGPQGFDVRGGTAALRRAGSGPAHVTLSAAQRAEGAAGSPALRSG